MKKVTLFLFAYVIAINIAFSQGTAINTTGLAADSSAILDAGSTSQGLLIPRMTEAQKNSIARPATSLLIYQLDGTQPGYYFNAGDKTTKNWMYVGGDNLGNHTAIQQLDMDTNKIINLATCTQNLDAANKKYVDSTVAAGGGGGGSACLQPDDAGTITGKATVCKGNSYIYSVAPIANASGYVWTLPVGAIITSFGNTNSITVNFTENAVSGNITVYGISEACNGTISPSYAVTVNFCPYIGQSYQGGVIAYMLQYGDAGYNASVPHGIIATPTDQSSGAQWGCYNSTISGADGALIGAGNQNTTDITNGCATVGIAAEICSNLVWDGYTDWYLPSRDELIKLSWNINKIGGPYAPAYNEYWSSTEYSATNAYYVNFTNGQPGSGGTKNTSYRVRCVRSY